MAKNNTLLVAVIIIIAGLLYSNSQLMVVDNPSWQITDVNFVEGDLEPGNNYAVVVEIQYLKELSYFGQAETAKLECGLYTIETLGDWGLPVTIFRQPVDIPNCVAGEPNVDSKSLEAQVSFFSSELTRDTILSVQAPGSGEYGLFCRVFEKCWWELENESVKDVLSHSNVIISPITIGSGVGCQDTDGGVKYDIAGTVIIDQVAYVDQCVGFADVKYYLDETYCQDNVVATTRKDCRDFGAGFVCESSRCVKKVIIPNGDCVPCADSDGTNYIVQGTVSCGGIPTQEDVCVDNFHIQEYTCGQEEVISEIKDCRNLGSNLVCLKGACVGEGAEDCSDWTSCAWDENCALTGTKFCTEPDDESIQQVCTRTEDLLPSACGGQPTMCGDGRKDISEECDDGNNNNGDGCSATCKKESWLANNYPALILIFIGVVIAVLVFAVPTRSPWFNKKEKHLFGRRKF